MTLAGVLRRDWRQIAAALGAVLVVAASLAIAAFNERTYVAGKSEAVRAQTEVLAGTVEPALVFQDPPAAQDAVRAFGANGMIEAVGVYDQQGRLVASLDRDGQTPPPGPPLRAPRRGLAQVQASAPVVHEGARIGDVYIRTRPESLAAMLTRHAGTGLILATAVLVLSLLQALLNALSHAVAESRSRAEALSALNDELRRQNDRREVAEEALRQAQKLETIGRLTGGIAHDFNNLLQAVQGNLEFLKARPNDPKAQRWAASALQAAERGARLTAQLLAFSRTQKLEAHIVEAADVVNRVRELLPGALGPNIRVVFEVEPAPATVMADGVQLEFALLNLCINARDAMAGEGEVRVSSRVVRLEDDPELPPGDYVRLAVADTGPGMPLDVRQRAFEPFFTTKGVGKGTGLGLAQVYGVARQAGGVARIHSEPGEGAEVAIIIPLAVGKAPDVSPGRTDSAKATRGGRVLIVDDDRGVREYMAEHLRGLGYQTLEAEDGLQGLETLGREAVDLLILDYAMPGMNGAQLAAEAHRLRPDLPILFASGYAETTALEAAVGGEVRLLRKPFDGAALASSVYEALNGRRPAA